MGPRSLLRVVTNLTLANVLKLIYPTHKWVRLREIVQLIFEFCYMFYILQSIFKNLKMWQGKNSPFSKKCQLVTSLGIPVEIHLSTTLSPLLKLNAENVILLLCEKNRQSIKPMRFANSHAGFPHVHTFLFSRQATLFPYTKLNYTLSRSRTIFTTIHRVSHITENKTREILTWKEKTKQVCLFAITVLAPHLRGSN